MNLWRNTDSMGLFHGAWAGMLVITPLGGETIEDTDVQCKYRMFHVDE